MSIKPNEAQKKALPAMMSAKDPRMVTVLPPGSGKTVLAAFHAKEVEARTVLYVAHRIEILRQAKSEFQRVFTDIPESSFGFVSGPEKEYGCRFVFASIQTLVSKENLNMLMNSHQHHFDYIVLDEYHHSRAKTYDWFMAQIKGKFDHFLGITATPFRTDGKDIFEHVGGQVNVVYEKDFKESMRDGSLVPFEYMAYFDNIDYSRIQWQGMNYSQKQLDKAYSIPERENKIIQEYVDLGMKNKQTLGFCVTIKHAERMAILFAQMARIRTAVLHHKVSRKHRAQVIEEFRRGKIRAIFTRDIFNEGIDFPEVECVVLLRPTISKALFFQQIGRGLRKSEGKTHCTIMDFIGNYKKNFEVYRLLTDEIGAKKADDIDAYKKKPDFEAYEPRVHFDKNLIDFWQEQEKHNRYVKQTILRTYKELRDKFHEPPSRQDLVKVMPQYNISFFFGTYSELMREAGEPDFFIKAYEDGYISQREIHSGLQTAIKNMVNKARETTST